MTLHSPPPSIPAGAKWVLVDLSQQTMTAYEGETAVFATLMSSGKVHEETTTYPGLYQVEHKMVYSDMHGEPDDPYDVDRVPYTLYFHKSEGLHGTYWHDHFGTRESHGCVNLSLADAHWLFDWAPPRLPEGWSTIDPGGAGLTSLWVLVEKKSALDTSPADLASCAAISAGTEPRNPLGPLSAEDRLFLKGARAVAPVYQRPRGTTSTRTMNGNLSFSVSSEARTRTSTLAPLIALSMRPARRPTLVGAR